MNPLFKSLATQPMSNPYQPPPSTNQPLNPLRFTFWAVTIVFGLFPVSLILGWYLTDRKQILLQSGPVAEALQSGLYLPVTVLAAAQIACGVFAFRQRQKTSGFFWFIVLGLSLVITIAAVIQVCVYCYAINSGSAHQLL